MEGSLLPRITFRHDSPVLSWLISVTFCFWQRLFADYRGEVDLCLDISESRSSFTRLRTIFGHREHRIKYQKRHSTYLCYRNIHLQPGQRFQYACFPRPSEYALRECRSIPRFLHDPVTYIRVIPLDLLLYHHTSFLASQSFLFHVLYPHSFNHVDP